MQPVRAHRHLRRRRRTWCAQIATKYLGKKYGLLDIDYVSVDSEGNPRRAVTKTLAEIYQNHRRRFFGADEVIGSKCNRAAFCWSVPTYGAIQETVRSLINKYPQTKLLVHITPKYGFGESLLRNAALFRENGIEHVGSSYYSLSGTEFSGYFTNALAAKGTFCCCSTSERRARTCCARRRISA